MNTNRNTMSICAMMLLAALATSASAITGGNALTNRANNDGANGAIFVMQDALASAGQVTDWGFFDNDTAGRSMTPLLLENVGGTFAIRGIGTTLTSNGLGAQSQAFGLVSGTDVITTPHFHIGWKDGTNGTNNAGVADFDNNTDEFGVRFFGQGKTSFATGDNLGAGQFFNREYSIEFSLDVPNLTPIKIIDDNVEDNGNGWSGWGGSVAAPAFLNAAGDIDNPALTNATAVPDALNALDGRTPFANNQANPTKNYGIEIEEGTYEFLVQMVNYNNGAFPDPTLDFNGILPDSVVAPTVGSGGDEIWQFLYTVGAGDAAIGQLITLSIPGSTTGNYGVDHILGTFTAPGIVPEPTTAFLGLLGMAGLGMRRRRNA